MRVHRLSIFAPEPVGACRRVRYGGGTAQGQQGGQLIEIETNTWSWPQGCGIWLAIVFGPILYFGAAIWLSTHGLVLLAEEMIGLVVAAGIAGGLVALARRAAFPRFAEFDGQVIR